MSGERMGDRAHEAIIEQASAWFVRHRSGGLSRAEKDAFLQWLRTSKLNMHEYFEQVRLHQGFAQALPDLKFDRAHILERAQQELGSNVLLLGPAPRSSFVSRKLVAALAAMLFLAAGGVWIATELTKAQSFNVPRGEQRTVQLPDGSTVHINVSSQVRVKYSRSERLIELDRGQALFDVAHDAARPFRVRAGDAEVIAVGTQFDVYRRENHNVTVTVLQGKVDVIDARAPQIEQSSASRLRVAAGERVQIDEASSRPVVRPADVRAATAWMRREVIFNGESLAQVAQEINRYIAVPVRIEDEELSRMRVRAVFNAYDADSFIAFLKQYDVEVRSEAHAVHVKKRGSTGVSVRN